MVIILVIFVEEGYSVIYFDQPIDGNIGGCFRDQGNVNDCWYIDQFFKERCFACDVGFFMDENYRCWKSSVYDMRLFG